MAIERLIPPKESVMHRVDRFLEQMMQKYPESSKVFMQLALLLRVERAEDLSRYEPHYVQMHEDTSHLGGIHLHVTSYDEDDLFSPGEFELDQNSTSEELIFNIFKGLGVLPEEADYELDGLCESLRPLDTWDRRLLYLHPTETNLGGDICVSFSARHFSPLIHFSYDASVDIMKNKPPRLFFDPAKSGIVNWIRQNWPEVLEDYKEKS